MHVQAVIIRALKFKHNVTELLAKGLIDALIFSFGPPVLFVENKDGALCMACDYTALNKLTIKKQISAPAH